MDNGIFIIVRFQMVFPTFFQKPKEFDGKVKPFLCHRTADVICSFLFVGATSPDCHRFWALSLCLTQAFIRAIGVFIVPLLIIVESCAGFDGARPVDG